ncbi:MAG: coproporphyrinogen dehydrogenase HemZ [Clostridia bacterium]|nr:coproporphyrinogen dehydrogenase HemZ [Clostridia bacterium]
MNLCNINHSFNYELEKLCRIFLPHDKINILNEICPDKIYAVCTLSEEGKRAAAELFADGKTAREERICDGDEKSAELALATCLYECFCRLTGYKPSWGLLTGVRPVKLYHKLCDSLGEEKAKEYFKNTLFVSDSKIRLAEETMAPEYEIISRSEDDSFSLYISIPFCPTRCAYCSFVSHSVDKAKNLIEPYVELLLKEIAETGKIAKELGLSLKTVYIGGGTPVALSALQLGRVMTAVAENFDLSGVSEYTVEAGRPDAITEDKLKAIKSGGATRISINPQTMNDSVLREIGRNHTAEETVKAFRLARECGFDNINMDLIAGLPSDTVQSFKETVEKIVSLSPESVTVHSLSLKRASNLSTDGKLPENSAGEEAAMMVDYARQRLTEEEIYPYYLYRQSKTVGNLENVGYSKRGYEGLYNVYIMDETHTILACGASGVTKLREPNSTRIERIYNYKYPYEYIDRFSEMLSRKEGIKEFYKSIRK